MTHTQLLHDEKTMVEFAMDLNRILRSMNGIGILSMTTSGADQSTANILGPMADGIIEMRLKEDHNMYHSEASECAT